MQIVENVPLNIVWGVMQQATFIDYILYGGYADSYRPTIRVEEK